MVKSIALETEEKMYNLRFDVNAICRAEKMLGKSISSLGEDAGFLELRALTMCGLTWENNSITEEQAGRIMQHVISLKGPEYLSEKIAESIEAALPSGKK